MLLMDTEIEEQPSTWYSMASQEIAREHMKIQVIGGHMDNNNCLLSSDVLLLQFMLMLKVVMAEDREKLVIV